MVTLAFGSAGAERCHSAKLLAAVTFGSRAACAPDTGCQIAGGRFKLHISREGGDSSTSGSSSRAESPQEEMEKKAIELPTEG